MIALKFGSMLTRRFNFFLLRYNVTICYSYKFVRLNHFNEEENYKVKSSKALIKWSGANLSQMSYIKKSYQSVFLH